MTNIWRYENSIAPLHNCIESLLYIINHFGEIKEVSFNELEFLCGMKTLFY